MKSIDQIAAELGRLEPTRTSTPRPGRKHYPDPAKQEDHDYRQAYGTEGQRPFGKGLRAAFYAYLPEAPTGRWLTRQDAANYVAKIHDVIEMQCWPRHERERLRQLLRKWERRARGEDARFNALGISHGPSEKHRPKSVGDTLLAIRTLIRESAGEGDERGKVVFDKKWPLGRPVTR